MIFCTHTHVPDDVYTVLVMMSCCDDVAKGVNMVGLWIILLWICLAYKTLMTAYNLHLFIIRAPLIFNISQPNLKISSWPPADLVLNGAFAYPYPMSNAALMWCSFEQRILCLLECLCLISIVVMVVLHVDQVATLICKVTWYSIYLNWLAIFVISP